MSNLDKFIAAAIALLVTLVVAGCVKSNVPRAETLLALAKAAEARCDAAPAPVKKRECRAALACAAPAKQALHDRADADATVAAGMDAVGELLAADASEAAARAACQAAGVRVVAPKVAVVAQPLCPIAAVGAVPPAAAIVPPPAPQPSPATLPHGATP